MTRFVANVALNPLRQTLWVSIFLSSVVEDYGINKSVVSSAWKASYTIGTAVKNVDGGHPRKLTTMDDRYIVFQAKRTGYQSTSAPT
ncbi:hypothetical protein TNCV_824741 [Trichonephila clavipes]|nr:hypothetical protein TNCV_824741 [Trichonephila clavipes]